MCPPARGACRDSRSNPAALIPVLQSLAKWLERMADHTTNIAEQVIFMLRGKDIRHLGKLPAAS